jgi:hypothetical protein
LERAFAEDRVTVDFACSPARPCAARWPSHPTRSEPMLSCALFTPSSLDFKTCQIAQQLLQRIKQSLRFDLAMQN